MSKKSFKFEPDLWFQNRALRGCSPAARGFWIDILCLCHPSGYLHTNGKPVDDTQLARMVGAPEKLVRGWMQELGDAGIYSVDDRGLYASRMRKSATKGKSSATAAKKPAPRPAKRPPLPPPRWPSATLAGPAQQTTAPAVSGDVVEMDAPRIKPDPTGIVTRAAPISKALPWYKTPAGWARKANEQGLSIEPGEDIEDFKFRIASRIPPGPHIDALSPHYQKEIKRQIEQYELKEGEKSWAEKHGVRA